MANNIDKLRDRLFDVLDGLTNKESPMEIERAKAVCEVAQVIINSAKVEVDHLKITGGTGSNFIGETPAGVTRHRLKG